MVCVFRVFHPTLEWWSCMVRQPRRRMAHNHGAVWEDLAKEGEKKRINLNMDNN